MKTHILIAISLSILIFSGITTHAETITDTTNDVLHWNGTNYMDWTWNVGDKPSVDIVEIEYEPGNRLTISMKMAGTISNQKSWYHLWFNTSDAYYHVSYMPDDEAEPIATAIPLNFNNMSMEDLMNYTNPNVDTSVNGDTITATIDWVTEEKEMNEFWAWAQQWDNVGEAWSDYYIDFAPNEYSDFGEYEDYYDDNPDDSIDKDSNGSDTSDQGLDNDDNQGTSTQTDTPGFELVILLAAVVAFMYIRKKK
jgi:hypothetical protein